MSNEQIYHSWQVSPNGPWSSDPTPFNPGPFNPTNADSVVVFPDASGYLHLFYTWYTYIFHSYQNPDLSWSAIDVIPGIALEIVPGLTADGRIFLLCPGAFGVMTVITQTTNTTSSDWAEQQDLCSSLTASCFGGHMAVTSPDRSGTRYVFYRSYDPTYKTVFYATYTEDGGWNAPFQISGATAADSVVAEVDSTGLVTMFFYISGGPLAYVVQNADLSFGSPQVFPLTVGTAVLEVSLIKSTPWTGGNLQVFWVDTSGKLLFAHEENGQWIAGGSNGAFICTVGANCAP